MTEQPQSKFHRESNHRLRKFIDAERAKGKTFEAIGDRLGVSGSHLSGMHKDGDGRMSRTLDLAVEALMARDDHARPFVIVAVAPTAHWPTIKALIVNLGGGVADGVRDADERIYVDQVLAKHVPDYKKRFAFRLYMEQVPFKSIKFNSIAAALKIDESTARLWIEEVQATLKRELGE